MNVNETENAKREHLSSLMKTVGLTMVIDNFQNILDVIWTNVFNTQKFDSYVKPRAMTCPGIISSIDTLKGINELCEIEDYADAYLLIRRLRDNLFLDLFLFEAQKTFGKIPSDSLKKIDFNNPDEVMKELQAFYSLCVNMEREKKELKAIDKWKNNELLMSKNSSEKKEFFQFEKYLSYLSFSNDDFSECYRKFLKNTIDKMGLKLNDYAHSNGESLLIAKQKTMDALNDIKETLTSLEHLFLISLFFVDATLFSSEDYGDYISCNMTPPEGSQYLINGYIQDAFIDIESSNNDLFQFLLEHNRYSMKIGLD